MTRIEFIDQTTSDSSISNELQRFYFVWIARLLFAKINGHLILPKIISQQNLFGNKVKSILVQNDREIVLAVDVKWCSNYSNATEDWTRKSTACELRVVIRISFTHFNRHQYAIKHKRRIFRSDIACLLKGMLNYWPHNTGHCWHYTHTEIMSSRHKRRGKRSQTMIFTWLQKVECFFTSTIFRVPNNYQFNWQRRKGMTMNSFDN